MDDARLEWSSSPSCSKVSSTNPSEEAGLKTDPLVSTIRLGPLPLAPLGLEPLRLGPISDM